VAIVDGLICRIALITSILFSYLENYKAYAESVLDIKYFIYLHERSSEVMEITPPLSQGSSCEEIFIAYIYNETLEH
jgi:hypothetical protein